jgi:hypothetical protein
MLPDMHREIYALHHVRLCAVWCLELFFKRFVRFEIISLFSLLTFHSLKTPALSNKSTPSTLGSHFYPEDGDIARSSETSVNTKVVRKIRLPMIFHNEKLVYWH